MEVIYILLSISIIIAIVFLISFIWSVKAGQYEDIVSPSIRILYEDEEIKKENTSSQQSKKSEIKPPKQ